MSLAAKIVSVGAWGREFRSWQDLQNRFESIAFEEDGLKGPKPSVIPANERRRAPLPVRLAVESSWQAVNQSPFSSPELSSVFVSALGDTQLTDYMCKVLAGENKQLSPTKFHNSVHNAAAGYWTISTECMKAANSVAGYEESVALTLLEAMTQISQDKAPMLLTFYDAPVSQVLKSLLKNDEPFSVSLVLAAIDSDVDGIEINAEVIQDAVQWPELDTDSEYLLALYESTPTAKILSLLNTLLNVSKGAATSEVLKMPLSQGSVMQVKVS